MRQIPPALTFSTMGQRNNNGNDLNRTHTSRIDATSTKSIVLSGLSLNKSLTSNPFGFGMNYLKQINKTMKISKALRVDLKVQRRYIQAQINDLSQKIVEFLQRNEHIDNYLQNSDQFLKEVQDHLVDFRDRFKNLKKDEMQFLEKTQKVIDFFEMTKSQNLKVLEAIEKTEDQMVNMKKDVKQLYDRISKESDLKFKKLILMEATLTKMQQEQDINRTKRTKEESLQK